MAAKQKPMEEMSAMAKTETDKMVENNPSEKVVILSQTKPKKFGSVIPARRRLVKTMMYDSIVKSFGSSSASSESDKAADNLLLLSKKNNNIFPDDKTS